MSQRGFVHGQGFQTIEVDSVRRPVHDARGRPIAGGDFARLQRFWDWAGETKAIDNRGRPLMVFHGTGGDFYSFDPARSGESSENHTAELGIFFSVDADVAAEFVPRDYGVDQDSDDAICEGANLVPAYLSICKPFVMRAIDFAELVENGTGKSVRALRKRLESLGFDGVHIVGDAKLAHDHSNEMAHDSWVAFRPAQIKSAVGNHGTFLKDSPHLTDAFDLRPKTAIDLSERLTVLQDEEGDVCQTPSCRRRSLLR